MKQSRWIFTLEVILRPGMLLRLPLRTAPLHTAPLDFQKSYRCILHPSLCFMRNRNILLEVSYSFGPGTVPMRHGQPRVRRLEIRNAAAPKRADIKRAQIRPAKSYARHPRCDSLPCCKKHLLVHFSIQECPLERVHLLRIAFIQKHAQFPARIEHKKLVGVYHGASQVMPAGPALRSAFA